ncbi:hypothetical protein AB1Y20_015886 [Prymnesium parvum]|uniref:LamG domain-containing protein n=1 Tax=Prymnesium parvum TaxID=97485 RepID=A0AB34K278_PRYPA
MGMRNRLPLLLFFASLALALHICSWALSATTRPPRRAIRFAGHWMFALQTISSEADDINVRTSFDNVHPETEGTLPLHVQTSQPLHVVARSPAFVRLRRTAGLPAAPIGSVYIDRPPLGSLVEVDTNCLRTREPQLRSVNVSAWSLEAVVLFLDSPHFGRAWQTFVGRNGCRMSPGEPQLQPLASIYLKLTPQRTFLLEAFAGEDLKALHQHVAVQSAHIATPNAWYHVAGVSDGASLQLWVNGHLEASAPFAGALRRPPFDEHGDMTFGCGMFDCNITDPCSCLLSEARIADRALRSSEMLWGVVPPPPPSPQERSALVSPPRRTATSSEPRRSQLHREASL